MSSVGEACIDASLSPFGAPGKMVDAVLWQSVDQLSDIYTDAYEQSHMMSVPTQEHYSTPLP
jgi:hypothetical protein